MKPAEPFVFPPGQAFRDALPVSVVRSPAQGPSSPNPNAGQNAGPPGFGPSPVLVHEAGGNLVRALQPPAFDTWEMQKSVLPEAGFYSPSLSPSKPFQFDIGSFQVPPSQHLWLMDYEFSIYRQSGIDPGDFVKSEDGRFTNVMGFDITVNGRRMANLFFQLDPAPIATARSGFQPPIGGRASQAQFDAAAANNFVSTAGQGLSLLPARAARMGVGPTVGPFTIVAQETSVVTWSCVIFNRVLTPIAKIEGDMKGYLVNSNVSNALMNRIRAR